MDNRQILSKMVQLNAKADDLENIVKAQDKALTKLNRKCNSLFTSDAAKDLAAKEYCKLYEEMLGFEIKMLKARLEATELELALARDCMENEGE